MYDDSSSSVDFFVSYNSADVTWAEWVGEVLEANDFKVIVQKWDFRPGQNFVLQMHKAASEADRTILILSPNSIESRFTGSEWAAAFVDDPQGSESKLVPVRVALCDIEGLLKATIYIDLVGLSEEQAEHELLQGIGSARKKPQGKVPFPGSSSASPSNAGWTRSQASAPLPTGDSSLWHPSERTLETAWQHLSQSGYMSNHGTLLELHLVPAMPQRFEVRRLVTLSDDLIAAARATRLFDNLSQIDPKTSSDLVVVEQAHTRDRDRAGVAATRSGDRGAWFGLPSDGLGAVFDPAYIVDRLASLIDMLVALPLPTADAYGVSVAITSPILLTIGDMSVVGSRNSSIGMGISASDIVVDAEDTVSISNLQTHRDGVAQELVARLEMKLRDRR